MPIEKSPEDSFFWRTGNVIRMLEPLRRLQVAGCAVLFCFVQLLPAQAKPVDISRATIIVPADADGPERAAVNLLVEEAGKRMGSDWRLATEAAKNGNTECAPCIVLGRRDQMLRADPHPAPWPPNQNKPEAFRIAATQSQILITGEDDRGVLYGIGYLLRHLRFSAGHAILATRLPVVSAPQFAVRGHQLGYRFKNNTYDAWTPQRFEQYIRDLAVFGANTIELLPPVTDDAPSSPLFPLPAMDMMTRVSEIVQKYGLRVSVFYPAMAKDYTDPQTVRAELLAWGAVFRKVPQIDELFVPGGDPGHTDPAVLFPFLEKVAVVLHQSHPNAGIWVSAQGFNAAEMQRFYALVSAHPRWLAGVVVGPQSRDGLAIQREHIPRDIPIRFYPDIAHTMHCQFPVPEWDLAYALTEGREVIDPRPWAETAIFRHYAPFMSGFITYSEGVNDDVNKFIWSALGWSAQTDPRETLRQYARYFAGDNGFHADEFARAIEDLEENWKGPLAANTGVDATLRQLQQMRRQATAAQAANWRFQEALYRACTDAYERRRLIAENGQEQRALRLLSAAPRIGSQAAMHEARSVLAPDTPELRVLRTRRNLIEELAGQLFHNIGLQLSVAKYGASAINRGASLDTADVSLNDRVWLENEFTRIAAMPDEAGRLRAIAEIVHRQDAGPGGFYDDLGDPLHEPHLLRGPGYPTDPAFFKTALDGIANRTPDQGWRLSEISYAGALYDHALQLRYTGLNGKARYRLRIVYAGEDYTTPLTLTANDRYVIHGPHLRAANPEQDEYPIPPNAIRDGMLDLKWTRPKGMGGGGRGLQVAEVWLLRQATERR